MYLPLEESRLVGEDLRTGEMVLNATVELFSDEDDGDR
jgi:hypothetical protein